MKNTFITTTAEAAVPLPDDFASRSPSNPAREPPHQEPDEDLLENVLAAGRAESSRNSADTHGVLLPTWNLLLPLDR